MDIIDWSLVNWVDVSVYSGVVLVAAIIAMLINRALGDSVIVSAILTTILFAIAYVAWNYYPHGIDVGQTHVVGATVNSAPAPEPVSQPSSAPAADPSSEPTSEPMTAPATEPSPELTTEPTTEASPEPATEPSPEPATEPTTEPAPAPSNQ